MTATEEERKLRTIEAESGEQFSGDIRFITADKKVIVCPICWRNQCSVFRPLHVQAYTDEERRKLIKLHKDVQLCDVCKKTKTACNDAKDRHADALEEAGDSVAFLEEQLRAINKITHRKSWTEASERLWKKKLELRKLKRRVVCKYPKNKVTPLWYPNVKPQEAEYSNGLSSTDRIVLTRVQDVYEATDHHADMIANVLGIRVLIADGKRSAFFSFKDLKKNVERLMALGHTVAIAGPDGNPIHVMQIENNLKEKTRYAETLPVEDALKEIHKLDSAVTARVYVDGGCVKSNPSRIGGTWAVVALRPEDIQDDPHWTASGSVTPAQIGMETVSNNVAELIAAIEALERLPDKWTGTLYTDSKVTMLRLTVPGTKMNGVPLAIEERLKKALLRTPLLQSQVVLLNGHPTKKELESGIGKRGLPTSKWNVLADSLCGEEADKLEAK